LGRSAPLRSWWSYQSKGSRGRRHCHEDVVGPIARALHKAPAAHGSAARADAKSNGGELPFELFPSKLAAPPLRSEVLRRTRLVDRLRGTREARVVSIVAPAGYGKTTVLAQWAKRDRRPFAWVSLDDADNDPVVLLTYVAAALDSAERIDPKVFRGLRAPGDSLWSVGLPRLGAALGLKRKPTVVVLDDIHELRAHQAIDAIAALTLLVPEGSQLVFSGRSEAAVPLAKIRASGRLLEIGPSELALTDAEARALLAAAGLGLSDADANQLNRHAEGWAAGLYLAALAFDTDESLDVGEFAGDDRFVSDYLRSEHLARMTEAEVEFLTRTSVLGRMSAPLCDAVLRRTGSAKRLSELERSNLFVVALDHHGGWYRYQHLFREMLQAELARREPERVSELNRLAAAWCERNGMQDWAIEYAVAADDLDHVAALLESHALAFYRTGRVATVERWLTAFDEQQLLEQFPTIAMLGTWIHALRGRPDEAERWALAVRSGDARGPWPALVDALLCRHGVGQMRKDAEHALAEIDPRSAWHPPAMLLVGISALLAAEVERAEQVFAQTADAAVGVGARYSGLLARAELALIALARGDVAAAEVEIGLAEEFFDPEAEDYLPNVMLFAARARVALAAGRASSARESVLNAQRLRPLLSRALPWLAVQTLLELAKVSLALEDASGARTLCLEADDVLHQRQDLGTLVAEADALRAELADAPRQASGWASTLTAAELRLLPLLTTHLSFREIAERLFVSRNTVKTQAISVYRKLDATSRSEAIARAVELGLVDESSATRPGAFTPTG
jgi:LuxR family transcriptional regulator, maltose regulon positive regulatory protein